MDAIGFEILIILLLLLANGVFAMTEMAVISSRQTRLRALAADGQPGAAAALALAAEPNRFLSTVQIGITLVGVVAGTFGGATLAEEIAARLAPFPTLAPHAESLGFGIVVLGITYFSLVLGELVPKRLALAAPERIATAMAGPMNALSRLAHPIVRLLGLSTDLVTRLLGVRAATDRGISEDEIRLLMEEGTRAGVFHTAEPRMVESVLALDHLAVREIMTPRARIMFLNRDDPHAAVWHKIVVSGHSHYPVFAGQRDHIVGIVSVKSIYANLAAGAQADLAALATEPLVVPETQSVAQLIDTFKTSHRHIALVADEFGSITGLVTPVDVLEAIVGEITPISERLRPQARRRDDSTWLIDGPLEIEALQTTLPALPFPPAADRDYETAAGFILSHLGRVPAEGETFDWHHHRFEIIDMDRHRVDKILITALPPPPSEETPG